MAQPEGEVFVLDRRRHLPDEPDRAGDRGAGGAQDHRRRLREPRLSVHPPAPDVADRRSASATSSAAAIPATNRLEGEYLPIDLAANAASFGARAWHVETPEQFAPGAARRPAPRLGRA